jgi:predicted DNA-binding transcriptional regulator AlpA
VVWNCDGSLLEQGAVAILATACVGSLCGPRCETRNRDTPAEFRYLCDRSAMESNDPVSVLSLPAVSRFRQLTRQPPECSVDAVNPKPVDPSRRLTPAGELREAFNEHGEVSGRAWKAQVRTLSPGSREPSQPKAVVRIDVDPDEALVLAALIRAAARCPGGDPAGSPASPLLGTEEVARLTGNAPSTIRSWLTRNLPRHNPFPRPARELGRNQWRQAEIETWQKKEAGRTTRGRRKKREPPQEQA